MSDSIMNVLLNRIYIANTHWINIFTSFFQHFSLWRSKLKTYFCRILAIFIDAVYLKFILCVYFLWKSKKRTWRENLMELFLTTFPWNYFFHITLPICERIADSNGISLIIWLAICVIEYTHLAHHIHSNQVKFNFFRLNMYILCLYVKWLFSVSSEFIRAKRIFQILK